MNARTLLERLARRVLPMRRRRAHLIRFHTAAPARPTRPEGRR